MLIGIIVDNSGWSGEHLPHVHLDFEARQNNGHSFSVGNLEESAEVFRNLQGTGKKISFEKWGNEIDSYKQYANISIYPQTNKQIKL